MSEPPRPSRQVLPSLSRAMKPWVMTTGVDASSRCSSAASGANEQVAESTEALADAPRGSADSMSRASIQVTSMPCDLRKRAPISVAMSSPLAITRARVLIRQLAHQRDAVGHLPQFVEIALQLRADADAELGS